LRAQRLLSGQRRRRGLLDPLQLQRSCDALVIEALQQAAERLGGDARPAAVDCEADHLAVSSGVRRREQRSGPHGTRLVFDRELEAQLSPFVHQAALELAELFD
jgi:hypothetical protein